MGDLDLLGLEMDLLWGPDLFGRPVAPHPLIAVADAGEGRVVRFDPAIPKETRAQLEALVASGTIDQTDASDSPLLIATSSRAPIALRSGGGPSFVMRGDEVAPTAPFRILDSDGPLTHRPIRPGAWGDDEEWEELLDGRLGPWAAALLGERTVGVCYTPVASLRSAEAGVWTDPIVRGRGCAPLVTAAWAAVARRSFDTLFYSTSFENEASQAVARKLGLRPLGTIRQLWLPD